MTADYATHAGNADRNRPRGAFITCESASVCEQLMKKIGTVGLCVYQSVQACVKKLCASNPMNFFIFKFGTEAVGISAKCCNQADSARKRVR